MENKLKKILWVKFGWSDYYRGGPVDGNFGWLNKNRGKKNGGRGHEAFNFEPDADGTYYCYVPPQASTSAPSNEDKNGWTVICLAKDPKSKGIHVVGWYENATLLNDWVKRLTAQFSKVNREHPTYDSSFCITSQSVYFVPPEFRNVTFSHAAVRQGKYSFLTGPNVKENENKKRVLSILERRISALRKNAVHNPTVASVPDPEIDSTDPLRYFGTPEHRKKVEKTAERVVIKYYKDKRYKALDVTKSNCGHDFVFSKGKLELHVEVKGTSGQNLQFFLTRNEHNVGYLANTFWRLAIVTSALSDFPQVKIYNKKELKKAFNIEPLAFFVKSKLNNKK